MRRARRLKGGPLDAAVRGVAVAVLPLVLGGCLALSSSQLYDSDTLTTDDGLPGVWAAPDDTTETWEFARAGRAAYRLTVREAAPEAESAPAKRGVIDPLAYDQTPRERDMAAGPAAASRAASASADSGSFEVHVVDLDGQLYLDVYPDEIETPGDLVAEHLVRGHSIWRYERDGDGMRLAPLATDLVDRLAAEGARIPRVGTGRRGTVLLALDTAELQDLLRRHADDLFGDPETLQRLR